MQQKISIVFPVYNEAENLPELYRQVIAACETMPQYAYELVFVENGSVDASLQILKDYAAADARVRYLSLSRNFGHQGGIFAGLSFATGDAVITMDADLQHPPSLIPKMIRLWEQDHDVVFTTKRNPNLSMARGLQVRMFYWLISKVSGLSLSFGQSDFRLMDRQVIDVLLHMPEYEKFMRGLVSWVGFKQVGLEYDVHERFAGESKFSYRSLVSFALDGILSFSVLPLRFLGGLGLFMAGLSVLYALYALIVWVRHNLGLASGTLPPGWASILVSVTLLGGIQLIAIGILGEYLGRVYNQTKSRPIFIVRESSFTEIER